VARKKHHTEHPDERWLVSYADMLTLLFALFIVMYAMALVDTTKFNTLKVSLKQAFSSPIFNGGDSVLEAGAIRSSQTAATNDTGQDTPVETLPANAKASSPTTEDAQAAATDAARQAATVRQLESKQDEQLDGAAQKVRSAIARAGLTATAKVTVDERGLVIRLVTDDVLFRSGSYALEDPAKPLLATVAHTIDGLPNVVHVEGNTDSVPYQGLLGNYGLSADRAAAVMLYLGRHGLDLRSHRAQIVGNADSRPLQHTSGASQANRRVEVVVVRRQFKAGSAAEASAQVGAIGADPVGLHR
jgi:chemotaxis protein MotB